MASFESKLLCNDNCYTEVSEQVAYVVIINSDQSDALGLFFTLHIVV